MQGHEQGIPSVEIPVDAASLTPSPSWVTGDARKEESQWDHLEVTRRQNDRRWLAVYGWILVIVTVLATAVFAVAGLIWSWHQLAPESWGWLSQEKLGDIKSTLSSSSIGALVFSIVRTQIGKAR